MSIYSKIKNSVTIITLMLLLLPLATKASGINYTLKGVVSDSSGDPLSQAIVKVLGANKVVVTNGEGLYSISLPSGEYKVSVEFVGYREESKTIVLNKATDCDFTLEQDQFKIDEVIVYGKGGAQYLKEGAFSVNAVDIASLRFNSESLDNIVGKSAGVKVREEGGMGSDYNLSINGLSGNSIQYFIDGVPMNSKGGNVNLSNYPVNNIERVEVYKGVVPTYLGGDALGGAVNIVTKSSSANYLDLSISGGSFHTASYNLSGQYKLKNSPIFFRPTVSIDHSKNDYTMRDVEVWDDEEGSYVLRDFKRFHDNYFSAFGQLEGGVKDVSWADLFTIGVSYSKIDKDVQTGSVQSRVYGDVERKRESYNIAANFVKKGFLLKKLNNTTTLSYTHDVSQTIDTTFRHYSWDGTYINSGRSEIRGGEKSMRNYIRPLALVRSNFDYSISEQHLINFNYMLSRTENRSSDDMDDTIIPSNDMLAKHIFGLSYIQSLFDGAMSNNIFVKDYLSTMNVEQSDEPWITNSDIHLGRSSTNSIGYGVGSKYTINRAISLKASYEKSYRLPTTRELMGNGTTLYPNFDLRPESSDNINVGIYGSTPPTRHRLLYDANFFYRDVKDYISLVVSSDEDGTMQYDNVKSVFVKGFEAELKYNISRSFRAVLNATYQDSRSKTRYYENGEQQITYNNRIPNVPWLYGNLDLSYSFFDIFKKSDELQLGYYYGYVHWFFLTWEGYGSLESKEKIPTQNVSDISIAYLWGDRKYSVSLECNNLTNQKLYDNYMLQKPGRSFFAKFRVYLNQK